MGPDISVRGNSLIFKSRRYTVSSAFIMQAQAHSTVTSRMLSFRHLVSLVLRRRRGPENEVKSYSLETVVMVTMKKI